MGCDIHLHTEIKVAGVWYHYSQPRVMRNYSLFTKMAGVRPSGNLDDDIPISTPKGLPEDISVVTKLEYDWWEGDAHSMSWLGKAEIKELYAWLRENTTKSSWEWGFEFLFGNSWDLNGHRPVAIEDFRFVFWFDN